jgi:hypothetical protein
MMNAPYSPTYTNQRQIRRAFWNENPQLCHRRVVKMGDHRDYPIDTRVAFCDYVDFLARNEQITEALAQRVTL